ncbi:MAG TPA: serine hydrolase [Gemmatimonadaceae bacterium]|nr:serine hydrolase [Gemmatimonadaceae bacterium]
MSRTRRRLVAAVSLGAFIVIAAAGWRAAQIAAIGVAYKAKLVCSGIFVSKRDPTAVLADLGSDDLRLLKYIGVSADTRSRTVTTSALGLLRRRAAFRDGLGCALLLDGLTPPASPTAGAGVDAPGAPPPIADALAIPGITAGVAHDEVAAVVQSAFAEPDPRRPRRTQAVVVVHHGQVVGERYAGGIAADTPLIGWSMTKSVLNALVGVLVKQGHLTLDAPVPIPEWRKPGDLRGSISLDHLLRMSSGLRFDEDMENPRADVMRMLLDVGDAAGLATKQVLVAAPGSRWQYSSGTSNIIARVIRNTLRDDAEYLIFPRHALFDRVGMTGAVLETDAAGTFVGSSYMYATAREWARFGMLFLRDGVWGEERILPEGWVEYSRSPAPADPSKRYGAHFWLHVPNEYCGTGSPPPPDAFHAAGHEGQFVTIVPSRDAVIVRLGRTRHPKAWDHCAFVRDVLAALDEVPK